MLSSLPPGSVLMLGSLLLFFLRGPALKAGLLALPVLNLLHLWGFSAGDVSAVDWGTFHLVLVRADSLSLVWGWIFSVAALLASVYALHVDDRLQHVSALSYAGAAIAAVFAGDLVSLFLFWEMTAITSVFLVWAQRTPSAYETGMRYLIWQVLSGVTLLAAILIHAQAGGDMSFGAIGWNGDVFSTLVLLAFGIKAAFPLLHSWLIDAYPAATPTGTVFLSSFTTKLAIYALVRAFAGTEALIYVGAIMVVWPIIIAVSETDMRRVLALALNQQLGFMVVAIGVGSEMAINGVAAHAVAHILYKSLLFMAFGAVLYRNGSVKQADVGGIAKTMPWTAAFAILGAASMGVPYFAGFVSKSVIMSAVGHEHMSSVWLILLFGTSAVFFVVAGRAIYQTFFGPQEPKPVEQAPVNMGVAMGLTAIGAIIVGASPQALYSVLPYEMDYHPYTVDHIVAQLQTVVGSLLAFGIAVQMGIWRQEDRFRILDTDWIYRVWAPKAVSVIRRALSVVYSATRGAVEARVRRVLDWAYEAGSPSGRLSATVSTGRAAFSVALMFLLFALTFFNMDVTPAPTGDAHGEEAGHH